MSGALKVGGSLSAPRVALDHPVPALVDCARLVVRGEAADEQIPVVAEAAWIVRGDGTLVEDEPAWRMIPRRVTCLINELSVRRHGQGEADREEGEPGAAGGNEGGRAPGTPGRHEIPREPALAPYVCDPVIRSHARGDKELLKLGFGDRDPRVHRCD